MGSMDCRAETNHRKTGTGDASIFTKDSEVDGLNPREGSLFGGGFLLRYLTTRTTFSLLTGLGFTLCLSALDGVNFILFALSSYHRFCLCHFFRTEDEPIYATGHRLSPMPKACTPYLRRGFIHLASSTMLYSDSSSTNIFRWLA